MPHEIESIAYFGATPWHNLGTPLSGEDVYNWPAACEKAGLAWDVELAPLVAADTQAPVEHRGVRRTSDGRILGVVGPRYSPLQNRDAFRWFEPFLAAREARLETAGSLRGGARVWVLAKLGLDPLVIAKGDEVEKYILLSHGHDGSLAVRCGFCPIRVVCSNTLALAHGSDASKLIRVRHRGDVAGSLAAIREVMNLADADFAATAEQYRLLARKPVSRTDLKRYVKRVLKVDEQEVPSARTANVIERVIELAEAGRGNDLPSVRGTYWTAYQGLNEYVGYVRGQNPATRLDSLWFGEGAAINKFALQVAIDMAA
jgi:phage/plasmid-like protein (TIGR03299 family)